MYGVFQKFIPFHLKIQKKCMIILKFIVIQILQGSPCSVRTLLVNILVYEWQ